VQPVLKPVVALAGDVAELGPEAVVINDQLLLGGLSGDVNGLGLPLPHAAWGRHVLAAEEVWLVSRRVPNSWDHQYLGPPSVSQVCPLARRIWTVDVMRAMQPEQFDSNWVGKLLSTSRSRRPVEGARRAGCP